MGDSLQGRGPTHLGSGSEQKLKEGLTLEPEIKGSYQSPRSRSK